MNYYYEIYNPKNVYLKSDGTVYTEELFKREFPAVQYDTMAVSLYERTVKSVQPLSYLRGINAIKNDIPDDIALVIIQKNEELKETENSPIERIAAALEFLELVNM